MQRFALAASLALAAGGLQGCGSSSSSSNGSSGGSQTVPTWSYTQYLFVAGPPEGHIIVDLCFPPRYADVVAGANVTGALDFPLANTTAGPPFYVFDVDAKGPYWSWPTMVFGRAYNFSELSTCRLGDWQDESITRAQVAGCCGPENTTLCSVGLNGTSASNASRLYFLISDVQKPLSNTGRAVQAGPAVLEVVV